jgi:hypothetical protein
MGEKLPNPNEFENMPLEHFNDELFDFLDAQSEKVRVGVQETVDAQSEPVEITLHRMYGQLWANPASAPGELLDTTPETGSKVIELEGLYDFHSALTRFMNDNSTPDKLYRDSPMSPRNYKTGDGAGAAYNFRFFPDGRDLSFKHDGSHVDYPIDIVNSVVQEGVSRNEPVDEPNICLDVRFKSKDNKDGESETGTSETCTVDFPHANFLLSPDDPRHPDNWDSARVQEYLKNVIFRLLGIES